MAVMVANTCRKLILCAMCTSWNEYNSHVLLILLPLIQGGCQNNPRADGCYPEEFAMPAEGSSC
jgi:hypothetical protein